MKRRGATPEEDRAYGWIEEGPVTEVREESDAWQVTTGNLWTCQLRKDRSEIAPKVGDIFTTFGQIGYAFHGQALNGEVLWYQSVEDEEAARRQDLADSEARDRQRFEDNRAKLDAEYVALPETFRDRIDKFRNTNPDWRWKFEAYEMSCCSDAVKIARYCSVNRIATEFEGDEPTAADNVTAYGKLPYDEQKRAGISEGHSGNSFGFAVRLAYWYVTDPGQVVAEHGALTPLVGCDEYGCPHERIGAA